MRLPVLPLAAALALAAGLAARPTISIDETETAGKNDNVGDTRFVRADGRWWFLKKDVPASNIQRYGNLEAELLMARILTRFGFRVPQCRTVNVAGEPGVFLQTELVDAAFGGRPEVHRLDDWLRLPDRGRVDPAEVALLQVLDVVTGNGDRHFGNLFVATDRATAELLPIDNNLAFADETVAVSFLNMHFTPGFGGMEERVGAPGFADMVQTGGAGRSGTPKMILERNPLYADVFTGGVGGIPRTSRLHVPLSHLVRRGLGDALVARLVADLPDEDLLVADPAARRRRLIKVLRRRRDALPRFLRDAAEADDPAARRGSMMMAYGLPGGVVRRLPLSERGRHFVAARMFEDGRFRARETYYHLRAAGVGRLQAREVIRLLAEATDTAYPAKDLMRADRVAEGSGYRAALADFVAGRAEAARPVPAPPERGPRFFTVRAREPLLVRDGRGRPVAPEAVAGALAWTRARLDEAALAPGSTVEFERDVFAGPGGYRVYRTAADGTAATLAITLLPATEGTPP